MQVETNAVKTKITQPSTVTNMVEKRAYTPSQIPVKATPPVPPATTETHTDTNIDNIAITNEISEALNKTNSETEAQTNHVIQQEQQVEQQQQKKLADQINAISTLTPSEEEYEQGLTNKHWQIREAWAKRDDIKSISFYQYNRGLTDSDYRVRIAWINRYDLRPTDRQASRLYRDSNTSVLVALADRKSNIPPPTADDYSHIMNCTNDIVKIAWIARCGKNDHISKKELKDLYNQGLKDNSPLVRRAWILRKDIKPTPQQYEQGLLDDNIIVRKAWESRTDLKYLLHAPRQSAIIAEAVPTNTKIQKQRQTQQRKHSKRVIYSPTAYRKRLKQHHLQKDLH
jgi:hypothetical protein